MFLKTKADKHKNVKKLEPNFNLGKATATSMEDK